MARRRVLPDLVARLRLDASGFDNRLKNVEKSLAKTSTEVDKTEGALDRLGKRAGVSGTALKAGLLGAGGAAVAIGADLAKTGIQLEALNAKAEKVFGSEIASVRQWAKENAIAMGLTRREAVGLSAGLSDLLVPMGFARKEAAELSQRVVGLSGALAQWSAGRYTAAEVSEILQKSLLGERDALQGLGISITAAEVSGRLLEKGQKDLTGAALQQAEALATVELLFAKSKDAQDAANDSIRTTSERMAENQARFRDAKEELASGFLPILIASTEQAAKLGSALTNAFKPVEHNPDRKSNFALGLDTIAKYAPGISMSDKEVERIRGSKGAMDPEVRKGFENIFKLVEAALGLDEKTRERLKGGGGGGGTTNHITINADRNAHDIAEQLNRELDWTNRTRAGAGGRTRT